MDTVILKFRAAGSQRHLASTDGRPGVALSGSYGEAGAQLQMKGTCRERAGWVGRGRAGAAVRRWAGFSQSFSQGRQYLAVRQFS